MKPSEREAWIYAYIKRRGVSVDVLYADFVDDYEEATGAKTVPQPFGACKCRQLGRDLGRMYKKGILTRWASGLPSGDSSMGFPKWVWSYQLALQS